MERFWSRCDEKDDCWLWSGSKTPRGYGTLSRGRYAHRVAWEKEFGPIPDRMQVCHHCDNPSCVKPTHLFLGSQRDNVQDMIKKGRQKKPGSVCKRGHKLTPSKQGRQICLTCKARRQREYMERRKNATPSLL